MKKWVKLIIALSLIAALYGSWILYNHQHPRIVSLNAKTAHNITCLSQLEGITESIVKVKVVGEGKQFVRYDESDNTPIWGYTLTPVEVIKTYGQNEIPEKSTIYIAESYYYYDVPVLGLRNLITINNYKPLDKNKVYLLFVDKYTGSDNNRSGSYEYSATRFGKYYLNENIKEDNFGSLTNEDLDIFEANGQYKQIFKEVINKYK